MIIDLNILLKSLNTILNFTIKKEKKKNNFFFSEFNLTNFEHLIKSMKMPTLNSAVSTLLFAEICLVKTIK